MADKDPFDKMQRDLMETLRKVMNNPDNPQTDTHANKTDDPGQETPVKKEQKINFSLKPREVKKYLDKFVIKQDEAKRVLSTAVCDHYNHVKIFEQKKETGKKDYYTKQNIIMLGPTGVGKTHLIRHLAELIGVPFVKADATKFSETGYVGGDVDDLIRELVSKANDDIELAQYGIVYLDEVDKIASPPNSMGRDVSGSGVQRNLLKIMEDADVPLRNPQDMQSQIQSMMEFQKKGKVSRPKINTKHILFIVSGSFDGLLPIIEKRLQKKQIGFSQTKDSMANSNNQLLSYVQTSDFQEFGFESEFIGRLPIRVVCHPLHEEDLFNILTQSEDSILNQYQEAFTAYDIHLTLEERAIWHIAKIAVEEKTGARGLFTVLEKAFRNLKFELPSTGIKTLEITEEMLKNPAKTMKDLLQEEHEERLKEIELEIHSFEKAFNEENIFTVEFGEEALEALKQRILAGDLDTKAFLEKLLGNYHYGLELIQKKSPREKFVLPVEVVENPNGLLDEWIKHTYEKQV